MDEAMRKLVEAIEKASPIVWHAAYRQVWVTFSEIVFAVVVLLLAANYLRGIRYREMNKEEYPADGDDIGPVFCVVGIVASLGGSLILVINAMDFALNPTYWAIRQLKGLL